MTKTKDWSSHSPGKHKFAAFDFAADEERVEKESKIILSKFKKKKSPQKHISPVSKLTFLNSFARGEKNTQKEIEDEVVHIEHCLGRVDEGNIKCDRVSSSGSANHKPVELDPTEYHEFASSSSESTPRSARVPGTVTHDKHLSASRSLFPADNDPVIVDSDDDSVTESRSSKSPSTAQCLACAAAVLLEEQPSKFASHAHVTEALVVHPDHVIYGSFCSRKSCLEFSPKCIQLKALSISGTTRTHTFKWMLSDIVCIESIWCDGVKTARLKFHLKYETQRMSDARLLTVAVHNPNWSIIQEAIQSLDIFYTANWKTFRVETMQNELYAGQKRSEEPFQEVLYPKGDPGAISISKRDVDLLQPETFINDTIIDFYITYLMNNIPSEKRHMFHFFNCFFFQKLIGLDKDPSQACEGKTAFQRIRRWTMKVDIFNKDYIFVPINFSLHWSLIVICHPGEVAGYQDDDVEKSSRVPFILHMDSLRGSHKGLNNLFQSYLCEEWKARHGEVAEDVCRKFLDLQFVHLKLPQQENSFDCGLFLLHYVELFMEQAPVNFSPFRLPPRFLCQDWFKPRDVSQKRDHIKKLIYEILKQSEEYGPTDYYKYSSSGIDKEHASVEFFEELCMSTTEKSQISDLCYSVDAEVQIMSPPQTHLKSSKFAVSDFVFGPCFTPKAANFIDYHMHPGLKKLKSHGGKIMSPIEEEENMEEGFMDFTPAQDERNPQTELPPLMCPVNDSDKLPFETKSSGSSISPQFSPGESEVKSFSSFPGEKSVEWIVLDSQDENSSCNDDDTPATSSPQRTANTFVLCNLDVDPTENESNHIHPSFIQKEEEAEMGIEIIDISGADIEKVGLVVEDSEDEEDNIGRSKRRSRKTHNTMRRLIVDISEDLCI